MTGIPIDRPFCKKALSLAISLSLIWTSGDIAQAVFSPPQLFSSSAFLPQFELTPPPALGRIVDYYTARRGDGGTGRRGETASLSQSPLIILIQDLHAHYGVQKNIAGLLEFLSQKLANRRAGVSANRRNIQNAVSPSFVADTPIRRLADTIPFALAVEGAEGPIDSSVMALFPDQKIKQEALDYLMKEGELTGMEYFAAMRGIPNLLVGVEDQRYYNIHRDLFRKTLESRTQLVQALTGIQADISSLRSQVYSHSLKALQDKIDAFETEGLSPKDYIGYLLSEATSYGMDLKKEFPALASFVGSLGLSSRKGVRANLPSPNQLRQQTAEFLQGSYTYLSAEERQNLSALAKRSNSNAYYFYLRDLIYAHQLFIAVPSELGRYLEYLHSVHDIQMDKILHEAQELAFRLKLQKAHTNAEKDLVQVEHDLGLLIRMADLQATESEVRAFGPRLSQFMALCEALLHSAGSEFRVSSFELQKTSSFSNNPQPATRNPKPEEIRRLISSSIDYYVMALMRNRPMVEHTLVLGRQQATGNRQPGNRSNRQSARGPFSGPLPVAGCPVPVVLVAGGFHTAPITQLLKERNVSYVVITPSVDKITPHDHELYVKRLSGSLLSTEEILASVYKASFQSQQNASHSISETSNLGYVLNAGLVFLTVAFFIGAAHAGVTPDAYTEPFTSHNLTYLNEVHIQPILHQWFHSMHIFLAQPKNQLLVSSLLGSAAYAMAHSDREGSGQQKSNAQDVDSKILSEAISRLHLESYDKARIEKLVPQLNKKIKEVAAILADPSIPDQVKARLLQPEYMSVILGTKPVTLQEIDPVSPILIRVLRGLGVEFTEGRREKVIYRADQAWEVLMATADPRLKGLKAWWRYRKAPWRLPLTQSGLKKFLQDSMPSFLLGYDPDSIGKHRLKEPGGIATVIDWPLNVTGRRSILWVGYGEQAKAYQTLHQLFLNFAAEQLLKLPGVSNEIDRLKRGADLERRSSEKSERADSGPSGPAEGKLTHRYTRWLGEQVLKIGKWFGWEPKGADAKYWIEYEFAPRVEALFFVSKRVAKWFAKAHGKDEWTETRITGAVNIAAQTQQAFKVGFLEGVTAPLRLASAVMTLGLSSSAFAGSWGNVSSDGASLVTFFTVLTAAVVLNGFRRGLSMAWRADVGGHRNYNRNDIETNQGRAVLTLDGKLRGSPNVQNGHRDSEGEEKEGEEFLITEDAEKGKLLHSAVVFADYLTSRWPQTNDGKTSDEHPTESRLNYVIAGSLAPMLFCQTVAFEEMDESDLNLDKPGRIVNIPQATRRIFAQFARQIGDLDFVRSESYEKEPQRLRKGGGGPAFSEIPPTALSVLKISEGSVKLMCDPVYQYGPLRFVRLRIGSKIFYVVRPDLVLAYKALQMVQSITSGNYKEKIDKDFPFLLEALQSLYTDDHLAEAAAQTLLAYRKAILLTDLNLRDELQKLFNRPNFPQSIAPFFQNVYERIPQEKSEELVVQRALFMHRKLQQDLQKLQQKSARTIVNEKDRELKQSYVKQINNVKQSIELLESTEFTAKGIIDLTNSTESRQAFIYFINHFHELTDDTLPYLPIWNLWGGTIDQISLHVSLRSEIANLIKILESVNDKIKTNAEKRLNLARARLTKIERMTPHEFYLETSKNPDFVKEMKDVKLDSREETDKAGTKESEVSDPKSPRKKVQNPDENGKKDDALKDMGSSMLLIGFAVEALIIALTFALKALVSFTQANPGTSLLLGSAITVLVFYALAPLHIRLQWKARLQKRLASLSGIMEMVRKVTARGPSALDGTMLNGLARDLGANSQREIVTFRHSLTAA